MPDTSEVELPHPATLTVAPIHIRSKINRRRHEIIMGNNPQIGARGAAHITESRMEKDTDERGRVRARVHVSRGANVTPLAKE